MNIIGKVQAKVKFKDLDITSWVVSNFIRNYSSIYQRLWIIDIISQKIKNGVNPRYLNIISKSSDIWGKMASKLSDDDMDMIIPLSIKGGEANKDFTWVINRVARPALFQFFNNEYIPLTPTESENSLRIRSLSWNSPVNITISAGDSLGHLLYGKEKLQLEKELTVEKIALLKSQQQTEDLKKIEQYANTTKALQSLENMPVRPYLQHVANRIIYHDLPRIIKQYQIETIDIIG